jgi:carboxypeptidase family protein
VTCARLRLIAVLFGTSSLGVPHGMAAQGISTATIRGAVRTEDGANVDGASVHVVNTASGFTLDTRVHRGRFLVHGLEVGGPYVIEVRHIGFVPQRSRPVSLTLGEALELEFVLQRVATQLERVQVNAQARGASLLGAGGTATIIRDSLVQQLPTLNRNFIDFVQLAPQVSTKIGFQRIGMSAAGANLRFNNYLINGAEEHFVNSNVSPAHNAGKSIPIDAVKEYQVLVAPYDVRYGNFAGALVNTVTQSGTNEFRGSTYAYWRNNRLARGALDSLRYERLQYGFSLGGPIVRDRIHFFIAPEIQSLTSPALGPYLGQPSSATSPVPVRETDVERFRTLMRAHGLTPGSGGFVEVENPLRNIFVRLDVAVPAWNSRAVAFLSDARAEDSQFSRVDTFYLSSSRQTGAAQLRLASIQLQSELPRIAGGHNELLISHLSDRSEQLPAVRQPLVRVLVPAAAGGFVPLNAGATELAQGVFRRSRATTVKDELTLSWGADHVLVLGLQAEGFRIKPGGVTGGYGVWTFSTLDDFERGVAERFELRRDFGSANALLRGGQYGVFAGDEWRAGERVSISLGIRADLLDLSGHAPYNAVVDSIFGRRTDEMPRERLHFSPRVGFTWDLFGTGRQKLRGGIGVFTGRPPLAWLRSALSSYGIGIGTLRCGSLPTDNGPPPPFQPDYLNPPTACATGPGLTTAPRGDVDLLDRNLQMARSLRASLAYERQLPWGWQATTEFLFTRYLSDFLFVNLNLQGPQAVDRFGRVLYGTIGPSGLLVKRRTDRFSEVIDLRNTSRNYSQQLSTRVERRFAQGIAASAAYSYSGMRDVQSPSRINTRGSVIWADARAVSGRHEDEKLGISLNDLPHRAVIAATWSSTRRHWPTAFSLFYVGESGSPFTYRAGGIGSLGDLNADGSNANDPIYVPLSALDTTEIRFTGRSDSVGADNSLAVQAQRQGKQQNALDAFIRQTPCLRRQRGRIMQRNSCREPWSHNTVASFRQAVPVAGRALEFELDVFNVLNLLNPRWGHYRIAVPQLLEHVGQTASGDPIFRFHAARPQWTTLRTESAFQLQLALRYRF